MLTYQIYHLDTFTYDNLRIAAQGVAYLHVFIALWKCRTMADKDAKGFGSKTLVLLFS